jgi:hypothetical protein
VFNATFNNISVIAWRPVLVVEQAGVTTNHGQATEWQLLMKIGQVNKGNNKITELQTILQRKSQNS